MNVSIFYKILVFLVFACFIACQSTQKVTPIETKKDVIGELIYEIKKNIVPKYYNYETKKIIRFNLKEIKSNYDEEPLFDEYIFSKIIQEFKVAFQLDLNPYPDETYDVNANITIVKESNNNLKILSNFFDSKTQKVLYGNQHIFKVSDFDLMDFTNFKNSYLFTEDKSRLPSFISVRLITDGASYKAKDKYYVRYYYGEPYIEIKDTGSSGYYPLNIKCEINNKTYYPNHNKPFYEAKITPGILNFVASFQGGFWDAYNQTQKILPGEYSKKFKVNIPPNDNLKIDIFCGYFGKQSAIKAKVYRVKQVYVEGIIQEEIEIIEIFQ